MADHPAQTSGHWVADEMVVTVGGEKYWNWNMMDSETRYILASYLSKNRDTRAVRSDWQYIPGHTSVDRG